MELRSSVLVQFSVTCNFLVIEGILQHDQAFRHTFQQQQQEQPQCLLPFPSSDVLVSLCVFDSASLAFCFAAQTAGSDVLKAYDIVAAVPCCQRSFEVLCRESDVDLISLPSGKRLPFTVNKKNVSFFVFLLFF